MHLEIEQNVFFNIYVWFIMFNVCDILYTSKYVGSNKIIPFLCIMVSSRKTSLANHNLQDY